MAKKQQWMSPAPRNPPLPPTPPAPPSTHELEVQQSMGSQEISQETGISKNSDRAKWNHQMKIYLIALLKEHDVARFRTQNAWSKEAWTNIVCQFNKKFSLAYTIAQVKQKEQDLKKEYRTIKDLVAESGFGWDSDRMMVTAPPNVWAALDARRNKDALFWQDKSFPYYDDLFALYDGRYAEGRSCRGMDHYANKAKPPSEVSADAQPQSPTTPASSVHFDVQEDRDDTNWFGTDTFTPLGLMPDQGAYAPLSANIEANGPEQFAETLRQNSQPSSSTPELVDGKRPKKQKTASSNTFGDFHERYLVLKKEEIDRFASIEERKMEDPFSIKKCITTLEGLTGLQMGDMLKAADILKNNPSNREVFLSFSNDEFRVGWLLRQI